jgi:diadenosine tetraphosphate (Ap4A) HIT family hydrolase
MINLFPNEIILTTDNFIVAQDWEVPIAAFFILSTRRKIRSIAEFTDAEAEEFGLILKKVRRGMREALGITDVYFFQNEDSIHGFHVWMFPRYDWMKDFGTKIESVRPIMLFARGLEVTDELIAEVKKSAAMMREHFMHEQNIDLFE